MKLKVCGINNVNDLGDLIQLDVDFLGFIFYNGSHRNCVLSPELILEAWSKTGSSTQKIAVFVNESQAIIESIVSKYSLDGIQLHGIETPKFCRIFKDQGLKVIKAFAMNNSFDFNQLSKYEDVVDYFLFDTKGKNVGGNGVHFDWTLLDRYKLNVPFFLSGGIDLADLDRIRELSDPRIFGVDVNSKFELRPGVKNTSKIELFYKGLKSMINE